MKATTKRFTTSELVVYRMSNTTRVASFDTMEEAAAFAVDQKIKHPRSKKLTGMAKDNETGISTRVAF